MIKTITNKWFYSTALTIIVFLFISDKTPEIKIQKIYEFSDNHTILFVEDLNFDKQPEFIYFKFPLKNLLGIKVATKDDHTINQWNIYQNYLPANLFMVHDFDQDRIKEIFVVTEKNDSLFLHGLKYTQIDSFFISNLYLDKRPSSLPRDKEWDIQFIEATFTDYDKDGYDDMILHIHTGYAIEPRKIYIISLKQGRVIYRTPNLGITFFDMQPQDVDGDGTINFYPQYQSASANIHNKQYVLDDQYTRFFIFDKKFHFLFDPIPFGAEYSGLQSIFIGNAYQSYFLVRVHQKASNDLEHSLYKISVSGKILKKRMFSKTDNLNLFLSKNHDTVFLHVQNEGQIFRLNSDLETSLIRKSEFLKNCAFLNSFIFKGKEYYLFWRKNEFLIFDHHFRMEAVFKDITILTKPIVSLISDKNKLYFYSTEKNYRILYGFIITLHPIYQFFYFLPFLIFGVIFLLDSVIKLVAMRIVFRSFILQNLSTTANRIHILFSPDGKVKIYQLGENNFLPVTIKKNRPIFTVFRDFPTIIHFINQHMNMLKPVQKNVFIHDRLRYRLIKLTLHSQRCFKKWPFLFFMTLEDVTKPSIYPENHQKIYTEILYLLSNELHSLHSHIYNSLIELESIFNNQTVEPEIFRGKFYTFKEQLMKQFKNLHVFIENFDLQSKQFTNVLLSSILLKTINIFKETYPQVTVEVEHFHIEHEVILLKENFEYLILQILETLYKIYPSLEKIYISSKYVVSSKEPLSAVELEIFPLLPQNEPILIEDKDIFSDYYQILTIIQFLALQQNIQLVVEEYPVKPTFKLILQAK